MYREHHVSNHLSFVICLWVYFLAYCLLQTVWLYYVLLFLQCILGFVLCSSREERNMWTLQWSKSFPWLREYLISNIRPTKKRVMLSSSGYSEMLGRSVGFFFFWGGEDFPSLKNKQTNKQTNKKTQNKNKTIWTKLGVFQTKILLFQFLTGVGHQRQHSILFSWPYIVHLQDKEGTHLTYVL